MFIRDVLNDNAFRDVDTVNVVISDRKDVRNDLIAAGFSLHDETIQVTHDLQMEIEETPLYTFVTLHELTEEAYKKVWADAMSGSFNASSTLSIDDQLRSVERELGDSYKDSCMIVYEDEKAIGVVMPHIEPGTKSEGRLFYFGLVPSERGRGKSKEIHRQSLRFLRDTFGATTYIGNTSVRNLPMMKTFQANGCKEIERNSVYTLKRI
ncbi:GNAT family N-acetyltransferase [Alkalihalobacillus sp. R86527]|uniref:GNAT family N-acetyltransferase n=1 Tax=Alkalihalobacillus sp. R86527 TaxID=3093863 RepID=UPI0036720BF7